MYKSQGLNDGDGPSLHVSKFLEKVKTPPPASSLAS